MKLKLLTFILLTAYVVGLTGVFVRASTPSDDALLASVKQAFITAGWTPPSSTPPITATKPSQVLNLSNWYLGIPVNTAHDGNPDIIRQPELNNYELKPWFYVSNGGVLFSVRADGYVTENSDFPRTELRQTIGKDLTSWSNTSGTHTLEGTYSITYTLVKRKQIVFAQAHDSSSDIFECALNDNQLVVLYNNKSSSFVLEPNYVQGTKFSVKLIAHNGKFDVYYNSVLKGTVSKSSSSIFWKSGSYPQSNVSKYGEAPTATASVTIYSLVATQ